MIEEVESFKPNIQYQCVTKPNALLQSHIVVVDPRTMEESTFGISQLTLRLFGEETGVECGEAVTSVGVDLDISRCELRSIQQVIVYTVAQRTKQRIIGIVEQSH